MILAAFLFCKSKNHVAIPVILPYNRQLLQRSIKTREGVKFVDKVSSKRFWRKLLPLVFPIAFEQLMYSFVSASDALMLGLLDQASLSAVSLAAQVQFVFSLFMSGLSSGGSILAAQCWGRGQKEQVERVYAILLRAAALVGGVFFAAAFCVPGLIMRFFTPDPELIELGSQYLRVVSLSYLSSSINQSNMCIMKNTGRASRASLISSCCVMINLGLNAVLIFGLFGLPAMGVRGAALATLLAQLICLSWGIYETSRFKEVRLRRRFLTDLTMPLQKNFWKYTIPVMANSVVWGLGITMGSVVLGHLGTDAVAANSIASIAKNLIACFCNGLAAGTAILVGNELGAGQLERAKQYGNRLVILAVVSGVISGAILIALTPVIRSVAVLSDQAMEYLRWMIVVCAFNIAGMSHNSTTICGLFAAGGDTKFGFFCDAITLWAVVVPLGFLTAFVLDWPVIAVYAVICMDEIVKLPVVWRHCKKYRWVKDLTQSLHVE